MSLSEEVALQRQVLLEVPYTLQSQVAALYLLLLVQYALTHLVLPLPILLTVIHICPLPLLAHSALHQGAHFPLVAGLLRLKVYLHVIVCDYTLQF